jgi:hypothetical protein
LEKYFEDGKPTGSNSVSPATTAPVRENVNIDRAEDLRNSKPGQMPDEIPGKYNGTDGTRHHLELALSASAPVKMLFNNCSMPLYRLASFNSKTGDFVAKKN